MNWVRTAVILLVIAVALPVTESASNQDSPAVAAARRLIGDYKIIPGERVGTIRLGEATRDDFRRHFGLTNLYGYHQGPDVQWNWPERNLASGPGGPWDFPSMFVFCRSNSRLMATSVSYARSWVPDHGLLNLFVERLATPEGVVAGRYSFSRWLELYGKPAAVRNDVHFQWNYWIFRNGLFLMEPPEGSHNIRPPVIGVFNEEVCSKTDFLKSPYLPFLGRLNRELLIKKVALTRPVDSACKEGAEPLHFEPGALPKFKMDEFVCMEVELAFTPVGVERNIPFVSRFVRPDGRPRVVEIPRSIEPGMGSKIILHWLGTRSPRITGKPWRGELIIGETVIASAEFEVVR